MKNTDLDDFSPDTCGFAAFPTRGVDDSSIAACAVNDLGWRLLSQGSLVGANQLLSPYSIQTALAMAYAGADGLTRREICKVCEFEEDEAQLHASFSALACALRPCANPSAHETSTPRRLLERGYKDEGTSLAAANRLFGHQGLIFGEAFLSRLGKSYQAPLQPLNFQADPQGSREFINCCVSEKTNGRIRDIIPAGGIRADALLVLVNALHFKASWRTPFSESCTAPRANPPRAIEPRMALRLLSLIMESTY